MTPGQAKKALERAEQFYWQEVNRIAEEVRRVHVIPFCDKHKVSFLAGMGRWSFNGPAQKGRPGWPDKRWGDFESEDLPKKLSEVLHLSTVSSTTDLGLMVEEYRP